MLRRVIPLFAALATSETAFAQRGPASLVAPGTSALRGVLTDTLTKQPIAGCTVLLNQLYTSRNAQTMTGADGAYTFAGISDGEFHINTMCETYLPACYRAAGTEPYRCDTVGLVVDQRRANLDVALIPGANARGRVVDQRGRPIAAATVRLGMPVRSAVPVMSKPTQTKVDGSFVLSNLPAGEWRLELEVPEGAGTLRPPTIYFPGVLHPAEAEPIELVAGQTLDNITFVAPRLADNRLIVRVVTNEPDLSQLEVSFVRVEPLAARRVPVDDSGAGAITGVVPGPYLLAARTRSGDRILAAYDAVTFLGGEQEVLLYLQPAARIAGRVIGEKGAAIPFDGVRVGTTWLQDGVEVNPLDINDAQVAPDGTFRLDGLFATRKLQLLGLDAGWEIRSVMQGRTDVTGSGVTLTADTEARVVIIVGRR